MAASQGSRRQVSERLFDPAATNAEIVETHVSTIALLGDLAHKRKKPVRFAFVDLSTQQQRAVACQREIELNRRFSPDVYLGLEDVVDDDGEVVDHAVLMRRMPSARQLSALVRHGEDVSGCVRSIARRVAAYHADCSRSDAVAAAATPEALRELWTANLREMASFAPGPVDPSTLAEIGGLAHRYLQGRTALLQERIAAGWVVDGHGDLLADDIYCLQDGPRILDGLEFDDRLRWGDVLYDVGFLAMHLERLGRPDLGHALMDWYREYSAESHPQSLEHHYVAFRALVRAKISCLKGADEVAVRAHLEQCRRHLLAGRVRLVVVGGLPGTGKTTLARALSDALGCPLLRSDETRKQLAGVDPLTPSPAAYGEGLYTPAATHTAYQELLERARRLLARGESVVVDASFSSASWRTQATRLASELYADCAELCCVLPADVAAQRLLSRAGGQRDASDATPAVAATMARSFDSWPMALVVNTIQPLSDVLPGLLDRLGR